MTGRAIIFPRLLKAGDRVAIVSPASVVNADLVAGAVKTLRTWGYDPYVAPHALTRHGTFAATADDRYDDLSTALLDPSTRAVICSRGGYGTVHLLERLNRLPLADDPKWVVGFSDISALHALMLSKGIASVHSSMAKRLALGPDDPINQRLKRILEGERRSLTFDANPLNKPGTAEGRLAGGNIAVLAQLINTPFDLLKPGGILFIEDIAEPIYKVERTLYQLRLSGVLSGVKGLIIGQFTDYRPDANHPDMETMISQMLTGIDCPVAFGAPIGHIDDNQPLIEGAEIRLDVTSSQTIITYL